MKRVAVAMALALCAGMAVAQGGADGAMKVAKSLKVGGVKSMRIVELDGVYFARTVVEFVNTGDQAVRLQNGEIRVAFNYKGGREEVVAEPGVNDPIRKMMVDGKEVTTIDIVPKADEIFGTARIGTSTAQRNEAIVFKAATDATAPAKSEQTLWFEIGPVEGATTGRRMAGVVSIMGNPKKDTIVKMTIQAEVAFGIGDDSWLNILPTGQLLTVELGLTPTKKDEYIFR